jgi:hypothetical protein
MSVQTFIVPQRFFIVLAAALLAFATLLVPATSERVWAGEYSGDTIPASDGKGHFAVVRDSEGSIVWAGKKKFKKEERAQKKADKVAAEMNDGGFMDDCWTNPDMPGCEQY